MKADPKTCAGCGHALSDRPRSSTDALSAKLDIAPGVQVFVCGKPGARWCDPVPKQPCARRAIAAAKVCPGCGAKYSGFAVCAACADTLKRAREAVGSAEARSYCLDRGLLGRTAGLPSFHDDEAWRAWADRTVGLIARVAAAKGARRLNAGFGPVLADPAHPPYSADTGMPQIELDDEQRAAVEALGAAIRSLVTAAHREGYQAGASLLGRLAKGDIASSEFDRQLARWTTEGTDAT